MTFLFKNILVGILILAIGAGGLLVYLSSRVLYESMLNQVFSERLSMVESVGVLVFSLRDIRSETDEFLISSALVRGAGKEQSTLFFRLVNMNTLQIIESNNLEEVGTRAQEAFTPSTANKTTVNLTTIADREVIEIIHTGPRREALWMAIDRSFFTNPVIVFAVQQTFLLLVVFVFLGFLFYLMIRRFFVKPLLRLEEALWYAAHEHSEKEHPVSKVKSLGALLESFKGIAEKIQATLERDKLISKMKSDFITTTAHQLRTPLSGINWVLDTLIADTENVKEEQRVLLGRASEKNKEIIAIVGALLKASSIEQGKFGFHLKQVSLLDEIQKTITEERRTAEKAQITLSLVAPKSAIPKVNVDQERIRWVIRNIVENAIRYSSSGGVVEITLEHAERQLKVSVKDNGIGIPQEQQKHIFQKFFRTEEARTKRNEGSGLGLYIAKNIINYHGGRIWFESEEGKGSTFYFTIPLRGGAPPPSL